MNRLPNSLVMVNLEATFVYTIKTSRAAVGNLNPERFDSKHVILNRLSCDPQNNAT